MFNWSTKGLAVGSITDVDRQHALALLARADQTQPLVAALRRQFLAVKPQPVRQSGAVE